MFERLKRLYSLRQINESGLFNAVIKGWITEEQRKEIVNEG